MATPSDRQARINSARRNAEFANARAGQAAFSAELARRRQDGTLVDESAIPFVSQEELDRRIRERAIADFTKRGITPGATVTPTYINDAFDNMLSDDERAGYLNPARQAVEQEVGEANKRDYGKAKAEAVRNLYNETLAPYRVAGAFSQTLPQFRQQQAQTGLLDAQAENLRGKFAGMKEQRLGQANVFNAQAQTLIPAQARDLDATALFNREQAADLAGTREARINGLGASAEFDRQRAGLAGAQAEATRAQVPGVTAGDVIAPGFTQREQPQRVDPLTEARINQINASIDNIRRKAQDESTKRQIDLALAIVNNEMADPESAQYKQALAFLQSQLPKTPADMSDAELADLLNQ